MSEIFNVSVDYLLKHHSEPISKAKAIKNSLINHGNITLISVLGVWTVALLTFMIMHLLGNTQWLIFVYTVPVALMVWLILNAIWGPRKLNEFILSAFIWSVLCAIYLSFLDKNIWLIFVIGLLLQIITFLCFRIKKRRASSKTE